MEDTRCRSIPTYRLSRGLLKLKLAWISGKMKWFRSCATGCCLVGYPCNIVKSDVDWSNIPSDLLFLISQKLHLLSDFIHFRPVCKNWRMSASDTVSPSRLPWLIEFHYSLKHACIYWLPSCKIHTVQVPRKIKQKQLMGPGQTYLLACDCKNSSLSLFNPLNGEELPLPPLPVHLCKKKFFPLHIGPNQPKDGTVLLGYTGDHKYTFCQTAGEKWSILDLECEIRQWPVAFAFSNGMYFINCRWEAPIKIINANTGQVVSVIETHEFAQSDDIYLVESFGDILIVQVRNHTDPFTFHIYRLEYDERNNGRWTEMSSIGDRILFLGNYPSPYFHLYGISVRSCNVIGSKGNCIYLTIIGKHNLWGICRYDIGERRAKIIAYSGKFFDYWFIPSFYKSQP